MSLHDKALLIDLTLTSVTTSRIDQTVTADVLHRNAATKDAVRWVSRLWPKAALEGIISHDAATGRSHREMTLPWLDNSKRILPTAKFDDYMALMRQRRPERQDLVNAFIGNYAHWLQEAAAMRQGLFNKAEYPDAASAAGRFTFKVEAEPVPHRDDFRIRLSAGDMSEMQSVLDERLQAAERIARNDLVSRIVEPLVRIVDRLSDPDAKFQDSLIGNIRTIAEGPCACASSPVSPPWTRTRCANPAPTAPAPPPKRIPSSPPSRHGSIPSSKLPHESTAIGSYRLLSKTRPAHQPGGFFRVSTMRNNPYARVSKCSMWNNLELFCTVRHFIIAFAYICIQSAPNTPL